MRKNVWNKGLTAETDIRIKKYVLLQTKIRQEKYKSGEWKIWNKGLTISDRRVKDNIQKRLKTIRKKYPNGLLIWNKGLTAQNNEGVKKIALSKLGKKRPNVSGKNHHYFGKHLSKQHRKKLSISHKGQIPWIKGKKHTQETRKKLSQSLKGYIPWNKNIKCPQFSKENHPNWLGGISNKPYAFEFDEQLKDKIRKRDNYQCQICGITEEEHLIVYGKNLLIHHIDYNKNNSSETNLISLCLQCNSRVNFNRNYWKNYFWEVNKNAPIFSRFS